MGENALKGTGDAAFDAKFVIESEREDILALFRASPQLRNAFLTFSTKHPTLMRVAFRPGELLVGMRNTVARNLFWGHDEVFEQQRRDVAALAAQTNALLADLPESGEARATYAKGRGDFAAAVPVLLLAVALVIGFVLRGEPTVSEVPWGYRATAGATYLVLCGALVWLVSADRHTQMVALVFSVATAAGFGLHSSPYVWAFNRLHQSHTQLAVQYVQLSEVKVRRAPTEFALIVEGWPGAEYVPVSLAVGPKLHRELSESGLQAGATLELTVSRGLLGLESVSAATPR